MKTVTTRCQILRLKCTKIDFGWSSATSNGGVGVQRRERKGKQGKRLEWSGGDPVCIFNFP